MKVNKSVKALLSFIVLFVLTIIFSGSVYAARLYSRQNLLQGPNIGNTIMLGVGSSGQPINIFDENCHLYCVQHRAESKDALYVVDAYVNIEGKKATGYVRNSSGARTKDSIDNIVLAYLIEKENYYKGYSNEENSRGIRMRAIHEYLKTWYSDVGFYNNKTKSGLNINNKWRDSGFSLDNHKAIKQEVLNFIARAKEYAKNYNGTVPSVDKNNTSTKMNGLSNKTAGPFKISYTGQIESISVTNSNGNKIDNKYITFSTDKEGKNRVSGTSLRSGSNYYIQNTSGTSMKNLTIKLKDSEVLNAKIWFLERNDGIVTQRYIMTDSNSTNKPGVSIPIEIKPVEDISISGYVWVDVPLTKENKINNVYDNEEARISGVKVDLVHKSDNKVKASTTTNDKGEYTFTKKITQAELDDYFVKFNYSGTKYKNYIPVEFNSTDANKIVANGSRALANEMPAADDQFKGIATTYTGRDKESVYGLSGNLYKKLYNSNNKTLENINLGIRQLYTPKYDITENIAYVKLTIKGYTYNYIYGGVDGKPRMFAPKVSFQKRNDIAGYTRSIYPSDIVYNPEDATKKLNVSVIYRIDITNTENQDVDDQYKEKKLHITNIVNNFDTSRYELHDNNWEANGNTATIKQNYLKEKYGNGIEKNQVATSFIEFSVKEAAIMNILKHPEGIIEDFPTKVTSVGYHEYTRKDHSWNNGEKEQTHTSPYDQRSAEAPYLIFKLGKQRTLTGTVFEDTVITNNGEKLGNGTFENDKENVVGNVKVELLDAEDGKTLANLPVSHLYNIKDTTDGAKDANITEAVVTTDNKGNYTLSGLVPGYYFIRFTYGDGTQKIYDINGNEVSNVLSKDYKSTIVTSTVAKNALGFAENTLKEIWYKKLEGTNYSVAVDDLDTRKIANTTNTAEKSVNVLAGTAKVSITVENTETDSTNIEIKDNQQIENLNDSKFDGFNLGIIKQPNQEAKLEKIVSNMKLSNSQNNVIFDGNPQTTAMQGVSYLGNDKDNAGSTYVRAELVEENIYGSTLELKYAIKATNISDVNYYSDKYYMFGDKTGAYEVTLKIDEVTDYLDEALKYEPEASDATRITLTPDSIEETEGDKTTKKYIVKITDWKTLYTENNKERTSQKETSDTVSLGTKRYLSTEQSDMEIVNEAEITKIANHTDSDDKTGNDEEKTEKLLKTAPVEVHTNGRVKAVVSITPPTGWDKLAIVLYVFAGAAALAILSAGVVIIKKKVL